MKNRSKIISHILLCTSVLTFVSCGGSNNGGGKKISVHQAEQLDDHGIYRAVLKPLNTAVSGDTSGTVQVKIDNDDVLVTSSITGAPAGVKHLQNITTAMACPEMGADKNKDGLIDINEALGGKENILVPLDSDLSGQLDGNDYGPIANGSGSYVYRRSTSFSALLADLQAIDPDPSDSLIKIGAGNLLKLDGRVVIIHGVRSKSDLPDTVGTIGDLSKDQALPIACGQLIRVSSEDTTTGSVSGTSIIDTSSNAGGTDFGSAF